MGRSDTCNIDDMDTDQRDVNDVEFDQVDQQKTQYQFPTASLEALVELEASMAAEHIYQRLLVASESQGRQLASDVLEYGMRCFCSAFVSHFTRLSGGRTDPGERAVAASPGGWEAERSPTPLQHHPLGLEDSQSNASDVSSASAPVGGKGVLPTIESDRTLLSSPDGDFVDGDLRDGCSEVQVRSKSDASPSQRSSFLHRMSFKNLTQSLNPFSKRHSQDRKGIFRVPTSGSLPISDHDGNSPQMGGGPGGGSQHKGGLGTIRPRLASAPAADLTRIRPNKIAMANGEPETLSSSMFNLAGHARVAQRKSSLAGSSISSGRQSPVGGAMATTLPPPIIPEHDTLKKREEDLSGFAGFHPDATRNQAAVLVQQGGNGAFLIRASESDVGKFVLTFNGQGRPKHLRFCINDDGRCRVQSTWFESLADMVNFYRANPIPSETGHGTEATLSLMISRPLAAAPAPPPVAGDSRQRSYTSPFAPEAIAAVSARKGSAAAVEPLRQGGDYKMAVDPPLFRRDVKGLF